jgi:hypothetical protein
MKTRTSGDVLCEMVAQDPADGLELTESLMRDSQIVPMALEPVTRRLRSPLRECHLRQARTAKVGPQVRVAPRDP